MKVIRYRNCDDFDIQFLDEYGYRKEQSVATVNHMDFLELNDFKK